jgi:hypothetical protein
VSTVGEAFRIDLIDLLVSAVLPLAIIDVQEARHRVTANDKDSAIILAVVMQRDSGLLHEVGTMNDEDVEAEPGVCNAADQLAGTAHVLQCAQEPWRCVPACQCD